MTTAKASGNCRSASASRPITTAHRPATAELQWAPAELVRRADRLLQADACRAADLVAVDGDPARQEWIELNTESNVYRGDLACVETAGGALVASRCMSRSRSSSRGRRSGSPGVD